MVKLLKILFHMFFRLFFTVEYYGVENIPQTGPAVLASNHPSYFDPILIYVAANRPVSFLAWDKLFAVPILGQIVRFFGAIPVNLAKKDSNAFEQAMSVLKKGDLLGIFPEAGRSQHGYIESLKTGAARLAIFNKCALVPITITGAYEAWPVSRLVPLPRKITVKFHEPIVPDPEECVKRHDDPDYHHQLTEQWRESIDKRLLPGLKAQEALNKHFARPASHLRIFELVPAGVVLIMYFSPVSHLSLILPAAAYYGYLLFDIWFLSQGRITKIVRDLASPLLMLVWHPILTAGVMMPHIESLSLMLVLAALLVPYYWSSYYDTQRFMRGLVLAFYLSFALEIFKPAPFGLHWATSVFVFCYAAYHRPLHWYSQLIFLIVYGAALYEIYGASSVTESGYYLLLGLIVNIYMIVFKFTAHDGRTI